MSDVDWDEVNRVPVVDVLDGLGIARPNRHGKTFCVFHDENTPSMFIYTEQNRWWSFCCDRGGNVVNLVEAARNVTRRQAAQWLQTLTSERVDPVDTLTDPSRPVDLSERVLCDALPVWPDSARHPDRRVARTHEQVLHLLRERWRLGDVRRVATDFRLFLHPQSGLWVPHWQPDDADGWNCHGVRTRPVTGDLSRKFSLRGSTFQRLYRPVTMAHHVETVYPTLILCEGESDTWAMYEAVVARASGRTGSGAVPAVAGLPTGAAAVTPTILEDIARHRTVYLFLDDDRAGRTAARKIVDLVASEVVDMTSTIPGGRVAEARANGWFPNVEGLQTA